MYIINTSSKCNKMQILYQLYKIKIAFHMEGNFYLE
jgi:hypothetical protein